MMVIVFESQENTVGKIENAVDQHFLLFTIFKSVLPRCCLK